MNEPQLRPAIAKLPVWLKICLIAVVYGALGALMWSFARSDQSSSLTVAWPGSGWLAACLFLLPNDRTRFITAILSLTLDFLGQSQFIGPPSYAAELALVSLVNPVCCYLLVRNFCGDRASFDEPRNLMTFINLAVVTSAITAVLGFALVYVHGDTVRPAAFILTWLLADLPGLLILFPAVQSLFTVRPAAILPGTRFEAVALPLLVCVLTASVILFGDYTLLFISLPLLVAIAFRLGAAHASLTTLLIAITAVVAYKYAPSIPVTDPSHHVTPISFIQLFIAVSFLSSLPAALVVSEQARLRRRLQEAQQRANVAQLGAERASEAKSDFVATMSHELRSPLHGIIGFTRLLSQRSDLPADAQGDIANIQTASSALLTVVSDVLDFASLEQGIIRIQPTPFSVHLLCTTTLALIRNSAEEKGVQTALQISPDLSDAVLLGDIKRLRQVILNLLVNAFKFTDSGVVRLTVSRRDSGEGPNVALKFAVTDTGQGIAEEHLPLLFQRFSQVDSSHARVHGGSGLGLAISKRLIEAMDGRVGVESRLGAGSTFWFEVELPQYDKQAGTVHDLVSPTKSARILVVDDLELNRDVAEAMLQRSGYHTTTVNGGAQAVEAVRTRDFDLVLMDIQMPVMDGYEATRLIRASGDRFRDLPIVAMTANVAIEEVARCLSEGLDAHIGKPFDQARLVSVIEDQLARRQPVEPNGPR